MNPSGLLTRISRSGEGICLPLASSVAVMDWSHPAVLSWRLSITMGSDSLRRGGSESDGEHGGPKYLTPIKVSSFTSAAFAEGKICSGEPQRRYAAS